MATVKSYTDIEQSKKLAEILPIESADGGWYGTNNPLAANTTFWLHTKYSNKAVFSAWSLAALFGIISQELFDGEYVINITEGRDKKWVITYDYIRNENFSFCGSSSTSNLIDACVDIIIKLKEGNIL